MSGSPLERQQVREPNSLLESRAPPTNLETGFFTDDPGKTNGSTQDTARIQPVGVVMPDGWIGTVCRGKQEGFRRE